MIESLKELGAKCQKPRYKEVGNWMVRHILRDAALPVTWLLLQTPVTANQVTLASLIIGAIGIFCFSAVPHGFFLAGALLLQFWYYLDHVDGQIARYRGTACLSGRFFDFVTHHFIHGILYFFLGMYTFNVSGHSFYVIWGFAASAATFMFNMIYDIQYKTWFEKLVSVRKVEIRKENGGSHAKAVETNMFKRIFSLLHKLEEIHVVMNLLTLAAVLQLTPWFGRIDFRFCFLAFYGITVPVLAIAKITFLIRGRKIDHAFESEVNILE